MPTVPMEGLLERSTQTLNNHEHPLLTAFIASDGHVWVRCAFTDSVGIAQYGDLAAFAASEHRSVPIRDFRLGL